VEKRFREVLNKLMKGIEDEEEMNGRLVIVDNLINNLSDVRADEFNLALDYLEEHCAVYFPKEGFLVRF